MPGVLFVGMGAVHVSPMPGTGIEGPQASLGLEAQLRNSRVWGREMAEVRGRRVVRAVRAVRRGVVRECIFGYVRLGDRE